MFGASIGCFELRRDVACLGDLTQDIDRPCVRLRILDRELADLVDRDFDIPRNHIELNTLLHGFVDFGRRNGLPDTIGRTLEHPSDGLVECFPFRIPLAMLHHIEERCVFGTGCFEYPIGTELRLLHLCRKRKSKTTDKT